MERNDAEFLRYIADYVTAYPEVGAHVSDYVAKGIMRSRMDAMERAADFESSLAVVLSRNDRFACEFIFEKLLKWKGKAALKWDDQIERLDRKLGEAKNEK